MQQQHELEEAEAEVAATAAEEDKRGI